MTQTVDELDRLDRAFAGNLLLATFSADVRGLFEPHADIIEFTVGEHVQSRGRDVEWSYFPFGTTMISLVVELDDGRSVQVASIGREGAVGGIVSCGHAPAFADAQVMVGGPAMRVPMENLEEAKSRSGFVANIFCRFSDYLLAEVMQSVACNSFHPIQQRAARWLLTAQDRAGDRIELTQEALAGLARRAADDGECRGRSASGRRPDVRPTWPRHRRRPRGTETAGLRMLFDRRRTFRSGDRPQRVRRFPRKFRRLGRERPVQRLAGVKRGKAGITSANMLRNLH